MSDNPIHKVILLAEDDPDDIYLISEAIEESALGARLYIVQDGVELLDYLHRRGKFKDADTPRPDLILLDLNMPRRDGREALEKIKADPGLRKIPVVVLTTSRADSDLQHTYDLGASGYVPKPVSFKALRETIIKIGAYWLSAVQLPNHEIPPQDKA